METPINFYNKEIQSNATSTGDHGHCIWDYKGDC